MGARCEPKESNLCPGRVVVAFDISRIRFEELSQNHTGENKLVFSAANMKSKGKL